MSVTAAEGLRRRRLPCRDQGQARATWPARDRRRQAGAAAAVFTQNKFARRRSRPASNGSPPTAAWRRRDRQFGQRQCRHRRQGPRRCRGDVRGGGRGVGCDRRRDMLVCSTGLIGTPLPMRKILAAIPKLAEEAVATAASRRGQGHPHHRHAAQGSGRPGLGFTSAAWPRAAACSRPTWRPCSPS
jgi:glutamate N-acetyltransferase/amino-acid N-acetyltransferase